MRPLLLFDIDGTLIKTDGVGMRSLAQTLQEAVGATGPIETYSFAGKTDPRIVRDLLSAVGLTPAEVTEQLPRVLARYAILLAGELAARPRVRTLPGVVALLDRLASRGTVALGLLTGNIREGARLKLGAADLWERFPIGAFGDDSEHRPDLVPIAQERARAHFGTSFPTAEIVVIGDTPLDVACARAHGAVAVAVAAGFVPRAELAAAAPDVLLDDFADTEAALQALGVV